MKRLPGFAVTLALVAAIALPAEAGRKSRRIYPGPYRAAVTRVIDGDTIRVTADLWPGLREHTTVRLLGVDTPERRRPKCPRERALAKRATAFVRQLVHPGDIVTLKDVRRGKYAGRVVARLLIVNDAGDAVDLGRLLIDRGVGRPYFGGRKAGWCAILKSGRREEAK